LQAEYPDSIPSLSPHKVPKVMQSYFLNHENHVVGQNRVPFFRAQRGYLQLIQTHLSMMIFSGAFYTIAGETNNGGGAQPV